MKMAFAALPGWSYTEIEECPLPVLRMAIESANERWDDNNRWQAMIHGVKLPKKPTPFVKQEKDEMAREVKHGLTSGAVVKTFTRAQLRNIKKASQSTG